MDNKYQLKSMLNNLINDKNEEASLDFHAYITNKMKSVTGVNPVTADKDIDYDETNDD